jgi:cell division protein FtsB
VRRHTTRTSITTERVVNIALVVGRRLYSVRRRIATVGVAVLASLVGYHAVFGANGMLVYQHKRAEYRRLSNEIESLKKENDRLEHEIHALKTDPKAIEKEAREQLRYTRPGELVYVVPDAKAQPAPASAENH